MSDVALRVDRLEHWRDGNGKPGAAAILADHEKRITTNECQDKEQDATLAQMKIEGAVAKATERQIIVEAVSEAMKKRGKSKEGMVRAFGPYAAALVALLAVVLPLVFK
jgi:hypothetical protein